MAYKDSEELKTDERYPLGDYSLRIERSSVPGSTNDKIEAICTDKDGKNARKSIQVPSSTKLDGWYAEANETEVTVYVHIKDDPSDVLDGYVVQPVPIYSAGTYQNKEYSDKPDSIIDIQCAYPFAYMGGYCLFAGTSTGVIATSTSTRFDGNVYTQTVNGSGYFTYQGKTVYYDRIVPYQLGNANGTLIPFTVLKTGGVERVAWWLVYGAGISEDEELLVGRFAIDIEDAGGVGPGSDWTDPGDYDPDWEPDDPTHTLYVTVTGALSGRHNDPIVDPSYSYLPADKNTVKDYGCGGDGGHGGGGGAGASTVVIHKFATNQANSKDVTAIARRHGYGSGGGKGGKGGDGCILVYY